MGSKSRYKSNDVIKELYMEFLRYPNAEAREAAGIPGTRLKFADKHGVDRSTMWRWEQDNDFKRQVIEPALDIVTSEDWQKILVAVKEKAFAGNMQAVRYLSDFLGVTGKNAPEPVEPENELEKEMEGWSKQELEDYLRGLDEDECVTS